MQLNEIRKGLRVWVTNESKVPPGLLPYGTVIRTHDFYGDHPLQNIAVLLDEEGHLVVGLKPEDLDFE